MTRAILATLLLAGLGCKGKVQGPPVAAAPKPPESLSVPQTQVRLPPEQPIPPDAVPPEPDIPTTQPVPPPRVTPPKPKPATPARRTPPQRAATPAPAEPPKEEPEPEPPGPPLRPVLTPAQEQELRNRIDRSLSSARNSLDRAHGAPKEAVERVRAFIKQAEQARSQGDLVRARNLAERAETLAADLARTGR